MSGRSESRSETPRSENQNDEIEKQEITEQAPNTEETQRPPNEGISPSDPAPPNSATGWGPPPKWEVMVNQGGSGWGESNPPEQHNKPSWSNKQPNQAAPDRCNPSNTGWDQPPQTQGGAPPKNGWNQPPQQQTQQPAQPNSNQPNARPTQSQVGSNWGQTQPNIGANWSEHSHKQQSSAPSDRGPGGDQNISWNGQSQAQPPTSQAPPTQTGSNSAGALSTGSDWNRPSESHSGITWGGSSSMDTPTSQGDNRYSYPNTTLESINKIHNAYAIDHNLDEATQKLINSNDGWGKKPITQQTKWNIDESNQSQAQSRVTPGQNGTEWWQGDKSSQGQVSGGGSGGGHSGSDGQRKDQWRGPDQTKSDQNWPGPHGQWPVDNQPRPWHEPPAPSGWPGPRHGPSGPSGYPDQPPPYAPPGPRPNTNYPGRGYPEPYHNPNGWPPGPGWQDSYGGNPGGFGRRTSPSHPGGPPGGRWDDKADWNDPGGFSRQRPIWTDQPGGPNGWGDKPERSRGYGSHWDDDPNRLSYPNNMPPQFNTSHINMQNIPILKMAMEKGLLPSGINVNDPTYSSNQQLVHICRTLLSEIEKKSRLQMDLQQAYRGGRGGPNQPWNPVSHAQVQQLQQQLEGSTSAEQHLRQNLQQLINGLWNKSRDSNPRHPGFHRPSHGHDSFQPPNDRNPSWGRDKPKLDDDALDDSMASLKINNSEKQNMVDTGPPPFVPGVAWKGPVDHKDGKLDPYKNPDLTPGMADKLRNSNDFRGAQMPQQNQGWNKPVYPTSGHPDSNQGWPHSQQNPGGWPQQQQNPGWPNPTSDPIDRPSPNNTIPPNLLPADIFDNNQ